VMDDAKTLAEYNIKDGDFIVVMITKVITISLINIG
jgi:hypothetical protein